MVIEFKDWNIYRIGRFYSLNLLLCKYVYFANRLIYMMSLNYFDICINDDTLHTSFFLIQFSSHGFGHDHFSGSMKAFKNWALHNSLRSGPTSHIVIHCVFVIWHETTRFSRNKKIIELVILLHLCFSIKTSKTVISWECLILNSMKFFIIFIQNTDVIMVDRLITFVRDHLNVASLFSSFWYSSLN